MEIINREIKELSKETLKLDTIGFNSKGTLTFALTNGMILNFHNEELEKIKKFLSKVNIS